MVDWATAGFAEWEGMRQVVDIARKLELTSIALGCLTRKELCTAFARVNPNTIMTLQNCYNWQSGRSIPRSFSVFEDWAVAVGMAEGPHFVMSSSLGEFVRVLGDRFALPDELIAAYRSPSPEADAAKSVRAGEGETLAWDSTALLRGSFLALSPSWSPVQRGRLLAGALTLDADGGGVTALYQERILGRTVDFTGRGIADRLTCQLSLQCEANGSTFLMAFHLPALPGNLAGGVFAGNAIYDPNSDPTASMILLLRNHALPPAGLEETLAYLEPDETALADYLDRLGYGCDPALAFEREVLRLLAGDTAGPCVSVPRDAIGRISVMLDQRRLDLTGC